METTSSLVALALLVAIVRELRAGNKIAKSDPSLRLRSSERFRTVRMQVLEPGLALVIVGSLLASDVAQTPTHVAFAVAGGAIGYAFGVYRARSTFVASVPAHRGVILRNSIESYAALGLLVVVKIVAEQDLLPEGDMFRSIVTALLGFLLVESTARVITLVRFFRRGDHVRATVAPSDS